MKKTFIKLLAFLLIATMLLPSLVACKNAPPTPSDNAGGNGDKAHGNNDGINEEETTMQFFIESAFSSWSTHKVIDFESQDFLALNTSISAGLTEINGKVGYKWNTASANRLILKIPEGAKDVAGHYYFEISLYSEEATDATVRIIFANAKSKDIKLNFAGWKTFLIQLDNISVANPYPKIYEMVFQLLSGSAKDVYISELIAKTPVYTVTAPNGTDLSNPALYTAITDIARECIVGPETPLDNDGYRAKATSMQNNGKSSWELFKSTSGQLDTSETLFDIKVFNIPYSGYGTPPINGDRVKQFYEHIYRMAQGYGVPGTELYKNPELLADIITALDYGYEFYYGKDIVQTGTTYGNWWEWDIGIPQNLLNLLIIISGDVDVSLITKYLSPFDKIVAFPAGSACNLVDACRLIIFSAALQHDAYRLCMAKELMMEVFVYLDEPTEAEVMGDGGFYSDGSFIQHDGTPYAVGYGSSLINALSNVTYVLKDSLFALHGEMCERQFEWVLNGYRPFIVDDKIMSFLKGRGISGNSSENSSLVSILPAIIRMSSYAPDKYKTELLSIIKYVMQTTGVDFSAKMDYPLIAYCDSIENDTSIPPLATINKSALYGSMDRVVQHTDAYSVGIALSSTRIFKYESINGNNKAGWYHGDGMIYLYTDGYDYDKTFYWYANPYLMPGTTVSNAERKVECLSPSIYNTSPYAGGTTQGIYASIGFILGYPTSAGTFTNEAAKQISAKKSYFLFDNEIVCLGSDIYDVSGTGARTVVENRLWREDDVLSVNGITENYPDTVETEIQARTMHFTNMGGYVFLDDNPILYSKATHSYNGAENSINAEGSYDFLEISLSHGDGEVSGGKYAYVYLPEASVDKTEEYSANPDIVILYRNGKAHAVLEKTLGVAGFVFFDSETVDLTLSGDHSSSTALTKVVANNTCAVMVSKNADGSYAISVSDPTQLSKSVTVKLSISGVTQVVSRDSNVSASIGSGVVTVVIDTANARGETFNLTVK